MKFDSVWTQYSTCDFIKNKHHLEVWISITIFLYERYVEMYYLYVNILLNEYYVVFIIE